MAAGSRQLFFGPTSTGRLWNFLGILNALNTLANVLPLASAAEHSQLQHRHEAARFAADIRGHHQSNLRRHFLSMSVGEAASRRCCDGLAERVASRIAHTLASWRFVLSLLALVISWCLTSNSWDPYPYVLLNLTLSFIAAYTAPFIMMRFVSVQRGRICMTACAVC